MTSPLGFEVVARHGPARAGLLRTRRGVVETPTFMPVATHAHVRGLSMDEVASSQARFCLANTYHLLLRPGPEVIGAFGGVHRFMGWEGGVLTDSGGFQIFSLPGFREISEEGARFRSPYDNQPVLLTPESSVGMQQTLGSDVMMVLDVCLPSTSDEATTQAAMERTHRWALRSLAAKDAKATGQALFGIVQGGVHRRLREASAAFLTAHPFDGFAIGGLAVGEAREALYEVAGYTAPLLPDARPRYLMGVGTPIDLVESVHRGLDMFDCIVPAKMAQQGYAYTFDGLLRLARAEHRTSELPLEAGCPCSTCRGTTRAYLRHLLAGNHQLGARLLTIHNLAMYQRLMQRMRRAIVEGRWEQEYRTLRDALSPPKQGLRQVTGSQRGDFELVTTRSGARAVRHVGHGEVMHPVGPWVEANGLYVTQTKVAERLRESSDEPFRVLDVGLGAAANAVAVLEAARGLGAERGRPLEIVSLELDTTPVQLALEDPAGFPFLAPWRDALAVLLAEGRWESQALSWRLLLGDAQGTLDEADGQFDLVLFDPFSPEANPALWTVDFLRRVRGKAWYQGAQGTLLATYSAATPTRVALLLAGFYVGAGAATGTRQETTLASSQLELLEAPLGARWLERWRRSSARGPHGQAFDDEVQRAVEAHPQFTGLARPGAGARAGGAQGTTVKLPDQGP